MENVVSEASARQFASIFHALGDPVRLQMFAIILREGEICGCNLEAPLQKSQPTISHHTSILAAAGLIESERRGRWVWWRATTNDLSAVVSKWIARRHDPAASITSLEVS